MAHEEGISRVWCRFGQRRGDQGLPQRNGSVPGRRDHCRVALAACPVGGKQQSLWPCPIFRGGPPHERSIHDQGLEKVRRDGRLGVRHFNGRDSKPADKAILQSCFPCHQAIKARDLVFTRFAPKYRKSPQRGGHWKTEAECEDTEGNRSLSCRSQFSRCDSDRLDGPRSGKCRGKRPPDLTNHACRPGNGASIRGRCIAQPEVSGTIYVGHRPFEPVTENPSG